MNRHSKMKTSYIIIGAAVAACALLSGCAKDTANPYEGEALPTVSITTDMTDFVRNAATATLTLDHFIHSDVVVNLAVNSGINPEALVYDEVVTIDAGAVKKTIPLAINIDKAENLGNFTVEVALGEVENANVGAQKSISLGAVLRNTAVVNLVKGSNFGNDGKTSFEITLSRSLEESVVVNLGVGSATTVPGAKAMAESALTFDKTVTIPAGSVSATVPVTATLSALEAGINEANIVVASLSESGEEGDVVAVGCTYNNLTLNTPSSWTLTDYPAYRNYYGYTLTRATGMTGLFDGFTIAADGVDLTDTKVAADVLRTYQNSILPYKEQGTYTAADWMYDSDGWVYCNLIPDSHAYIIVAGFDENFYATGDFIYLEVND